MFNAGGSDYLSIPGVVIPASTLLNGVVSVNVSAFDDDRVELDETFSVGGEVMSSGVGREFPVVFQDSADVSIPSDDGIYLPKYFNHYAFCLCADKLTYGFTHTRRS